VQLALEAAPRKRVFISNSVPVCTPKKGFCGYFELKAAFMTIAVTMLIGLIAFGAILKRAIDMLREELHRSD